MMNSTIKLSREIKALVIFFITGLVLSGITAFPLETELKWLLQMMEDHNSWMYRWLNVVYYAVKETNKAYPFISYGSDWLAFAHLVIAVAFVGPLRDPVKNIWIIEFGMIACVMIFPLAFIAGAVRDIPIVWRLIDCSFGVIGFIPLFICHKKIRKLERLNSIYALMNKPTIPSKRIRQQ
jgi:hypothetical protein